MVHNTGGQILPLPCEHGAVYANINAIWETHKLTNQRNDSGTGQCYGIFTGSDLAGGTHNKHFRPE